MRWNSGQKPLSMTMMNNSKYYRTKCTMLIEIIMNMQQITQQLLKTEAAGNTRRNKQKHINNKIL